MYTEIQYYRTPSKRLLRFLCTGAIVAQIVLFAANEAGYACLPLGYTAHILILLLAVLGWWGLSQIALSVRFDAAGLHIRYFPYEWQYQHIPWAAIQQIKLLSAGSQPAGAVYGSPVRDFLRGYWLTHPDRQILHIRLNNGTELFISTNQPADWLDFLQHDALLYRAKGTSAKTGQN
jgi:hypothetical protein